MTEKERDRIRLRKRRQHYEDDEDVEEAANKQAKRQKTDNDTANRQDHRQERVVGESGEDQRPQNEPSESGQEYSTSMLGYAQNKQLNIKQETQEDLRRIVNLDPYNLSFFPAEDELEMNQRHSCQAPNGFSSIEEGFTYLNRFASYFNNMEYAPTLTYDAHQKSILNTACQMISTLIENNREDPDEW